MDFVWRDEVPEESGEATADMGPSPDDGSAPDAEVTPDADISDQPAEAVETYTPTEGTDVVGDPGGAADSWRYQEDATSCAIHAQGSILEQFGVPFDKQAFIEEGVRNGWFIPGDDGGATEDGLGLLLESHGIPVDRQRGATIADLRQAVADGKGIIVGVDTLPIWGMSGGHALWVTGVEVNPETGEVANVVCNDSGRSDGKAIRYDVESFVEAWQTGGGLMVSTQQPMPRKVRTA